jgi:hypothetical protein
MLGLAAVFILLIVRFLCGTNFVSSFACPSFPIIWHWYNRLFIVTKEMMLNAKSLFVVPTTDICTQLFIWFKVMCNWTTVVISLTQLKYSYPPLAGNILFRNILKQLCLLYLATIEFSCFLLYCVHLLFIGIVTYLVTYSLLGSAALWEPWPPLYRLPLFCMGSTVGIATELRAGRSGIKSWWGRDFPPVQTSPGAHPASCKMGTGSFPAVKCGRGVLLTTHPLLVLWSWKSRAIPLPTLRATPGL